ncbi:MAG: lysylphosphatidylglycerol synthase transmembrane domain-containing protein [Pseudolabrys sp.]
MRRFFSFLAKVLVSIFLLYLSLRQVDLDSLGQRLAELDWRWIGLVLILLCFQSLLGALRWREIVHICGAKLPAAVAVRYAFIGQFFSQVLPSTVGGDAARIWLLARGGAGWPAAIYSVLIDRVLGVSILAVLVVMCLPWTLELVRDPVARLALAAIGFGALGAAIVFLGLGNERLRVTERWWLTRHLATASRLGWKLRKSAAGARAIALSFVIHLMTVAVVWGIAKSAHANIGFVQVLFLALPVLLVSTIPISIAGWGVRETAMILAFSYAGLAENDGFIVSVLYGLTSLAIGAIGGIVWIASGYRWRNVKAMESETLAHDSSA